MDLRDGDFLQRDAGGAPSWREDPIRVRWDFFELPTADSHMMECRFECSLHVAASLADRRMFAETFLQTQDSVSVEQVREKLIPALRSALSNLVGGQAAADQVDKGFWIDAIRESADAAAFACGLEILPPFTLDVVSPTLRQHQLRQVAATRQVQQLQHAGDLLRQFQSLRQTAPDLPPGKLLERLAPADRGLTLQSLLMASGRDYNQSLLWAVAGESLVRIDPRSSTAQLDVHLLPSNLGPLRSVNPATVNGKQCLLIGAQRGIMIVSPDHLSDAKMHAHPNMNSPLGFNRVVCDGRNRIWASHGEAGIVCWAIDQLDSPENTFTERWSRNLQLLDDARLIYSCDNAIVIRSGQDRSTVASTCTSPIVGIVPAGRRMFVVRHNGDMEILERTNSKVIDVRHRNAPIAAASALPWQDDVRLLLASESGAIDCIGLDDSVVTQFCTPHRGLKMICATTDIVAAVSGDRSRLILWNSWDGQIPIGEIHLTSQTKHRIADVQFDE